MSMSYRFEDAAGVALASQKYWIKLEKPVMAPAST